MPTRGGRVYKGVKKTGRCLVCSAEIPKNRYYCVEHKHEKALEIRRAYDKKRSAANKKRVGPCERCGERPRYSDRARYCEQCKVEAREEILARRRKVVTGRCLDCGGPASGPRSWRCEKCRRIHELAKNREANERARRRQGQQPLVIYGTCQWDDCEEAPYAQRAKYCVFHARKVREHAKETSRMRRVARRQENAQEVLRYVSKEMGRMATGQRPMNHNTIKLCGRLLLELKWGGS